jgi:hypothetical protein
MQFDFIRLRSPHPGHRARQPLAVLWRPAPVAAAALALAACAGTGRFVDQPHLTINEPQKGARQAVGELFGSLGPPYTVKVCEADPSTKSCTPKNKGISATGVGGLFIPLAMRVNGLDIKAVKPSAEGLALEASLDATVDGIPPLCGTVGGKVISRDNNTASVEMSNFYCNWMVIGNVIANADFSIETINLEEKAFTGFYKLTFHGTGNATGSGYYKAIFVPKKD